MGRNNHRYSAAQAPFAVLNAALAGSASYTVVYYFTGSRSFHRGNIAWLIALQFLCKILWIRPLIIAAIVWIVTTVVGWVLPKVTGPV